MMQQHEASMQRQATSLEQQRLVMQQMEAARVASEASQRQHMETLQQLEENWTVTLVYGPKPRPTIPKWSLEDFLKHHPTKFNGKTSPNVVDQWMTNMERIFDVKMCPKESKLVFAIYMFTGEAEH